MSLRSKPNSSYASTRLTARNYTGGAPLSTFNKNKTSSPPAKPEPATDDEPLSSDEESEGNASPGLKSGDEQDPRLPRITLDEKLAIGSQDDKVTKGDKIQSTKDTRKKRGSEKMYTPTVSDDDDMFGGLFSSQGPKRRRTVEFRSKNSRGSSKAPSSSMVISQAESPSSSDEKSKKKPSASKGKSKTKGDKKADSAKDGFKVPMEIDIPSPVKSRSYAEFKMPASLDVTSSSSFATSSAQVFDDDSGSTTPLSSANSSVVNALLDGENLMSDDDDKMISPDQAFCPWCKEAVDPESLMRFQSQPKQRIREQQRFCESHKKGSAEKEWRDKGYPEINWDEFDERIKNHFADLEDLLVPDSASYYRNILDTNLKSGHAKNFRLTLDGDGLETISCGYYGTRGAGKM